MSLLERIEEKPPRLTIAIPALNRAALLGRDIESALTQTWKKEAIAC